MGWGDVIGAGIDFAGGIIGNDAARSESKLNRKWQERMSNTEMQRRVVDLKAAGLNPMLAVGHMGGSSTPSGSAAAQQNPSQGAGGRLALGLRETPLLKAQTDQSKATTAQELATADNLNARTATEKINAELVRQKINESLAMVENLTASAKHADQGVLNLRAQIPQIMADVERIGMDTRYKEAGIDQLRAETGLTTNRSLHSALDLQRAANEYRKHKTWVGKTLLPWEGPATKMGTLIGGGLAYRKIAGIMSRGKPWRRRDWKK